jgi:tetratricopeptide (TPR) repeat protein
MAYFNRGDAYYKRGDYDQAIADFIQTIKIDPNFPDAYILRGAAYKDKARADLETALKLNPEDAEARAALEELEQSEQ